MSNRLLAESILFGGFILLALFFSREVRQVFGKGIAAILSIKILSPILLLLGWMGLSVYLPSRIGVWDQSLLPTLLIWLVLDGFKSFFKINEVMKGPKAVLSIAIQPLKPAAIVSFISSTYTFGLAIEIFVVSFGWVLLMASSDIYPKGGSSKDRQKAKRLLNLLLVIALLKAGFELFRHWSLSLLFDLALSFTFPIWLSAISIPYLLLCAYFASYGLAFIHLRTSRSNGELRFFHRLALALILNFHLSDVSAFNGIWAPKLRETQTFSEAIERVRFFRRTMAERRLAEQVRLQAFEKFAGVVGTDAYGQQLDRRDFRQTIEVLQYLGACRSQGQNNGVDMLDLTFPSWQGSLRKNGFQLRNLATESAWIACRTTITGWTFAIGGLTNSQEMWYYDRPNVPVDFPRETRNWDHMKYGINAKNWRLLRTDFKLD